MDFECLGACDLSRHPASVYKLSSVLECFSVFPRWAHNDCRRLRANRTFEPARKFRERSSEGRSLTEITTRAAKTNFINDREFDVIFTPYGLATGRESAPLGRHCCHSRDGSTRAARAGDYPLGHVRVHASSAYLARRGA